MSTFERVQKIICEQLEIDSHLVTEDASISGDLGAALILSISLCPSKRNSTSKFPTMFSIMSELSAISLSSSRTTRNLYNQ